MNTDLTMEIYISSVSILQALYVALATELQPGHSQNRASVGIGKIDSVHFSIVH